MTDDSLTALRQLVGESALFVDEDTRLRAVSSWYPLDRKYPESLMLPVAVARPADTATVAAIVHWANETQTPLIPVGGASNTVGSNHATGTRSIALDLQRLDSVVWDEESLLVTAGAGCNLGSLEEQLNRHDYTLGQHLGSLKLATVGGTVATNAIGLLSGRYGRQADLTAALEVVLPTGSVVRPTLNEHGLFIGTEGRFGIITEATLRMRPVPEARAYAPFVFKSWEDAVDAARLVYRSDARPAALRILDTLSATPLLKAVGAEPASVLLMLTFEGEEVTQTGQYQLAFAVCQNVGGEPRPAEVGDAWFDGRQQTTTWAANQRPGVIGDVWAFSASWTTIKAATRALQTVLAPHTTRLALQLCHATPQGAALEAHWEAEGGAEAYHRLKALAVAAWKHAGGAFPHHFGGVSISEDSLWQSLKMVMDPNNILPPLRKDLL